MGRYVGCRVSVGGLTTSTANALYPTAPAIRSIPAVTGDLRLGGKLSCSRGVWDDEGITAYATTKQWLRDGAEILGATGDDFTVRLADIDHSIACRVRAADLVDSQSSNVYPTSPSQRSQPGIEGDPRLGRTLSCTRGTWDDAGRTGDYTVGYDWYRQGILVASGQTYTVTDLDVDKQLRCTVTVEGKTEANSPTIYGLPPTNLTAPAISGDARLGRTRELLPRHLGRPRHALRRHLPVAAQQRRDRRRHERDLRDHRRGHQSRAHLPRHRRRLHQPHVLRHHRPAARGLHRPAHRGRPARRLHPAPAPAETGTTRPLAVRRHLRVVPRQHRDHRRHRGHLRRPGRRHLDQLPRHRRRRHVAVAEHRAPDRSRPAARRSTSSPPRSPATAAWARRSRAGAAAGTTPRPRRTRSRTAGAAAASRSARRPPTRSPPTTSTSRSTARSPRTRRRSPPAGASRARRPR